MTTGEAASDAVEDWQRTSRLAVLFFLGAGVKAALGNVAQWAATLGSLVFLLQQGLRVAVAVGCGVAVLAATVATLRYWFFRFRLEEDRVRIRQGVLKRRELNVQFDRIQGVNMEQSPIFRLFGLVAVSFDTAGSTEREGRLPAVTPAFAESLRRRIKAVRHPLAECDGADADAGPRNDVLVRLGNADMIRIGLADKSMLVSLAAIPLLVEMLKYDPELSQTMFQYAAAEVAGLSLPAVLGAIAAGLLAVFAALAALTVVSAFLRFHNFTLRQQGSTLHTRRGLLTRKEQRVEVARIQQVVLSQSLLMRWFDRCRLRALSASCGPAQHQSVEVMTEANLTVPLVAEAGVRALGATVFAAEGRGLRLLPRVDPFAGISPLYIRARLLAVGILPGCLATALLLPLVDLAALLAIGWIPLVAVFAWQRWRRYGYWHDDHGLSCRSGLIGYRVEAFLFRKAQGVHIRRSPLQRRKGLATLDVALASGAVTVPFIDFAQACRLRDYILYKAESSRRPWH